MANGNVWLKRIEDRVEAAKPKKFVGKFQEASRGKCNSRIYPALTKDELQAGGKYIAHVNKDPMGKPVSQSTLKSVEDRWHPPTQDEDIWIPLRTAAILESKIEPLHERFGPIGPDEDICMPIRPAANEEFVDLSQVKQNNDRYKAYQRLALVEDAMVIYGKTSEELKQMKEQKLEDLKLQVKAANPSYLGVPANMLAGEGLYVSGGSVSINPTAMSSGYGNFQYSSSINPFDNVFSMNSVTVSSSPAVNMGGITITGIGK